MVVPRREISSSGADTRFKKKTVLLFIDPNFHFFSYLRDLINNMIFIIRKHSPLYMFWLYPEHKLASYDAS